MRTPHRLPARGTLAATASSWVRALGSWSWRRWSMPRSVEPPFLEVRLVLVELLSQAVMPCSHHVEAWGRSSGGCGLSQASCSPSHGPCDSFSALTSMMPVWRGRPVSYGACPTIGAVCSAVQGWHTGSGVNDVSCRLHSALEALTLLPYGSLWLHGSKKHLICFGRQVCIAASAQHQHVAASGFERPLNCFAGQLPCHSCRAAILSLVQPTPAPAAKTWHPCCANL